MTKAKKIGITIPETHLVNSYDGLQLAAKKLGWPEKKIVVKPEISDGMRGIRIIDENFNKKKSFYSLKPDSVYTTLGGLNFLGDKFESLIVSEYLPGNEYSVDVLANNKGVIYVVPRKRLEMRSGITFRGKVIEDHEIINNSILLAESIGLEYAFGFQYKENEFGIPSLIECNPRVQGTMVLSTLAG